MASLIYYPGFSVEDERWLKYALLYLDEISPIVPNEVKWQMRLNDMTALVQSETDLLRTCNPNWRELMDSAQIATDLLKRYLDSPDMLAYALTGVPSIQLGKSILNSWKQPADHNTQLFNGKFAHSLYVLCDEHEFCHRNDEGIMIPSQLANIYMSILANEIARERDQDIITDNTECNRWIISHETKVRMSVHSHFDVAQSEIDCYLPCELDAIPISRIIQVRNNRDFRALRRAFSHEVERVIKCRERFDYQYTLDDMLYAKRHLQDYLLKTFDALAVVATSVASFVALRNGIQSEEVIPLTLAAYFDLRATRVAYRNVEELYTHLRDRGLARKYVTEIRNLNRPVITR